MSASQQAATAEGHVTMDPVMVEIVRGAFQAAADDMRSTLVRSAYSPVIYESNDCSVGLFNRSFETLGQSAGLPFFAGALDTTLRAVADDVDISLSRPGDVWVVNDPYVSGSHLNDVTVFAPVFVGDELTAFVACKAHWEDIGAASSGLSVGSTEIFEEGLRLPPVRVADEGEPVQDVLAILMQNSRRPQALRGDLNAQIAACRMGQRRYQAVVERFGLAGLEVASRELFAATERMERAQIAAIPDGEYVAEGYGDPGAMDPEPMFVRVRVVVEGEELLIDTRGSAGLRRGNDNTGLTQSISGLRLAYKFLIRPDLGVNGGSFRSLKLMFDEPSAFAAAEPAACFGYGAAPAMAIDLVIRALAPAINDRVTAGGPGSSWNLSILRAQSEGERFTLTESLAGGWGGSLDHDGDSATTHMDAGDFRNTPVEVAEQRYPVMVHQYGLVLDSGGPGLHRGGLAAVKEYSPLVDGCLFSTMFGRTLTPSWGLFGGGEGSTPEVKLLDNNGEHGQLLRVVREPLAPGPRLRLQTGGGGGYGPAWQRPPQAVVSDVRRGYVSPESARINYGVVCDDSLQGWDESATALQRADLSQNEEGPDLVRSSGEEST